MADEIAALKQLQAGLNAAFEAVYAAKDAKSLATAKEGLIGLNHATITTAMGPFFSIVQFTLVPLHYMAVKIATDLSVFDLIASKPYALDELAQATKADARLLRRIMRMVTSIGWVTQVEPDRWEASVMTPFATIPSLKNMIHAHFDTRTNLFAAFPEWLKKHDYKTSWLSDTDNIWTEVNGDDIWTWMAKHPDYSEKFDSAISMQEKLPPELMPKYPFLEELGDIKKDSDGVTLVDVGGGGGQAIETIKNNYPALPGRFILQDLPKSIESLDQAKVQAIGFEPQSHNIFTEQPVKGARYYHMRHVLHDWNDEKCLEILAATRPALNPGYSKLLIVEFIMADVNPSPLDVHTDLALMTTCDGAVRSESEWRELLGKGGFKIERIISPEAGTLSVIEVSIA